MQMFILALFIIAQKKGEQPKCKCDSISEQWNSTQQQKMTELLIHESIDESQKHHTT